uniref:uncharacterized protein LOC105757725 n=1 Tax=Odobenus rosmarus divergens TaxID=9708 RepID=UPI00063C9476|nr:PREDICTED: uncharacterized protein LOC105757725 [Odobenus rosmarus divergens]
MLKEGNEEFALGHYNAEVPAGYSVIQRRHVRAAAPSLLPPPSPRAWQEKRATWSGNKGPRGPRRSGTRCHPTPGPKHRCSLGPAPRPHAPGPGRSQGGESRPQLDPDTRSRFLTAGKEIPASSFRQSSLPRGALTQAPEDPTGKNCRPTSSAPALSEAASTRLGRQRDPATMAAPGASFPGTRTLLRASHGLPSRPRQPSAGIPGSLFLLHCLGPARITWFISEEMEKLMSGASMGSRRKRAGIGPTESASRPRTGGAVEREDEWSVSGGCEEGAAPPMVCGDSLAR